MVAIGVIYAAEYRRRKRQTKSQWQERLFAIARASAWECVPIHDKLLSSEAVDFERNRFGKKQLSIDRVDADSIGPTDRVGVGGGGRVRVPRKRNAMVSTSTRGISYKALDRIVRPNNFDLCSSLLVAFGQCQSLGQGCSKLDIFRFTTGPIVQIGVGKNGFLAQEL